MWEEGTKDTRTYIGVEVYLGERREVRKATVYIGSREVQQDDDWRRARPMDRSGELGQYYVLRICIMLG